MNTVYFKLIVPDSQQCCMPFFLQASYKIFSFSSLCSSCSVYGKMPVRRP